ncbi:Maf family protein [Pseudorhodoplanes sinuspersici]|uniref:Nucleoside triphosphate pyrophosphatase n=1 Tax=Pseudorhodoplanes sinuspersici TaxID=1235591 RepID=A0A1W6ZNQ9_9HYPH|nr:Maf family protein [Pseudorhodoplanes sinuspersici]ARP99038.1 septum formation inhibitor Maf [Pseudorhodoplanes sinuspersici]RKE69319.1 septum formation protein [Pseudorhodoplanes sinuspersici]
MLFWSAPAPLVLASRSFARRTMLSAAGIPVEIIPAKIDERAIERNLNGKRDPDELALLLSWEKASAVSFKAPSRLIVGADQTLAMGSKRFNKPANVDEAREQLRMLRGQSHTLHSATTLVQDGSVLFKVVDTARLRMRNFSDKFLDDYLEAAGPSVTESVGGYQLEKLGIHLFERVEGDYFTILGMPLLPLLDFFRFKGFLKD